MISITTKFSKNGIQYGDLVAFMDFEYLRKNTAMNLATLASLAKAPSKPMNVVIDTKALTNFTQLGWDPPAFGKAAGYLVLIRQTTSPAWEKKIFTNTTSIRLPYSKDNYFFGVQSVGLGSPNESLPVIPAPLSK